MASQRTLKIALSLAVVVALLTSPFTQVANLTYNWMRSFWQRPSALTMSVKLENTSIAEVLAGLEHGQFTAVELVTTYIKRIEQLNPRVHAVSQLNPDALAIARDRDSERKAGVPLGILHGVPVLVKDVVLTKDGLKSTNGCSGLVDAIPAYEATVIRRLRDQGAILLGKTVPTQWANYRNPGRASGGWSAVGGQCLAPYHVDQDPSGSSSGSAVAACLGLAAATIGTETSGSLSSPAQRSAVFSIKPTVGLTSRHGVYTVSEWQDTVGVIGRTVRDAATILTAIAGSDPADPFTISDPRDNDGVQKPAEGTNFAEACTEHGLRGKRIAVPRHLFPQDKVVNAAFDEALLLMESLGASIVDNVHFSEFNSNYTFSEDLEWTLGLRIALRENMKKSLAAYEENPKSLHELSDVIKYTQETPEEENEKWGVGEWLKCEELGQQYGPDSHEFRHSMSLRNRIGKQIDELLSRTQSDFIFVPSIDTSANVGGCPTIGVPLGFYPPEHPITRRKSNGLVSVGPHVPFGGLFVGRRWSDFDLISAAHAFEQGSRVRDKVSPVISSDVELPLRKEEGFPYVLASTKTADMATQASLNYLAPLPQWDDIKPYEISGRVAPGQQKNNLEFVPQVVEVHDARDWGDKFALDTTGFEWVSHNTTEGLDTDASVTRYVEELEAFLGKYLEADMVLTFQYQIRKRNLDILDPRVRPPSNFVHVGRLMNMAINPVPRDVDFHTDVSPAGAEARIRFSFPNDAEKILRGSLWRPLFSPLQDCPLALCDSRTVEEDELVESDYVYPNFVSESLMVKHSPRHKWFYLPEQRKDELLIITNYDSASGRRTPHTGFELQNCSDAVRPRESIEMKVVVYSKE
ncbi:Amidase domain-containing protein [Fusarium keratoplasticum]|uniref:Amidase domain-containing protein n=1 Tax=Fusarium keratoplasticum TaxID=1328300 RepID=A0ACC0QNN9_9HYPO|nr:Amidase domain-containing protein [Fusarium keratoplasticum]KAI8660069.1 Amidase domain-containing protein [Fusarium keratoplasticum]